MSLDDPQMTLLLVAGILGVIPGILLGVWGGFWLARDEKRLQLIAARDEICLLKAKLAAHETFAAKSKFTAESLQTMLAGKR